MRPFVLEAWGGQRHGLKCHERHTQTPRHTRFTPDTGSPVEPQTHTPTQNTHAHLGTDNCHQQLTLKGWGWKLVGFQRTPITSPPCWS